jgi:glycosyltransferase involved in cell wall biosynthesis
MAELNKSGCTVVGVCKPGSKVDQFLKTSNVQCEYLPSYHKLSFASIQFVKFLLKKYDVENVHVHFHKDIWVPSIALRNDSQRKLFLSIYMGVNSKNDIFHRWIYGRVNALFSSSEEMNSRLHTLYPVPKEKIVFLPYGRRLEQYHVDQARRTALRKQLQVKEDEILVGTMLRIDPGKGVMDFARSFLYLDKELQRNVKYVIIGEPTRKGNVKPGESPYEPHCEAYLRQLEAYIVDEGFSERIILLGYQERLTDYIGAMDVFVFPSPDELYSLVVLDAMAMGLPVVAARAGGNLRQINDGINGSLYEVGDSRDLAKKLAGYIANPGLRKQHGTAGHTFVEEKHDMNATLNKLLQFYQKD